MWTHGGGAQYAGQNDAGFVALIAVVGGVQVLGALVVRFLDGWRRRRARSDYS